MQRSLTIGAPGAGRSQMNTESRWELHHNVSVSVTYELAPVKSSDLVRMNPMIPARIVSVETGRGRLSIATIPSTV